MKTPREILFEKHQSIEPKLDLVRRNVKGQLRAGRFPVRVMTSAGLFQVVRSFRWHLAGMSAAWVLVVMLNFEKESASTAASAVRRAPSAGTLLAAIRESRRLLLDVMEISVPPPGVDPGPADSRRRSGLTFLTIIVQNSSVGRAAPHWMEASQRGNC